MPDTHSTHLVFDTNINYITNRMASINLMWLLTKCWINSYWAQYPHAVVKLQWKK